MPCKNHHPSTIRHPCSPGSVRPCPCSRCRLLQKPWSTLQQPCCRLRPCAHGWPVPDCQSAVLLIAATMSVLDTSAPALQLRGLMQKRLNTTVEEANSNASHYEEVCRREKKVRPGAVKSGRELSLLCTHSRCHAACDCLARRALQAMQRTFYRLPHPCVPLFLSVSRTLQGPPCGSRCRLLTLRSPAGPEGAGDTGAAAAPGSARAPQRAPDLDQCTGAGAPGAAGDTGRRAEAGAADGRGGG